MECRQERPQMPPGAAANAARSGRNGQIDLTIRAISRSRISTWREVVDKSVESPESLGPEHTCAGSASPHSRCAPRQDSRCSSILSGCRARAGPADLILVTHPHPDHYDRKSIEGLRKEDTTIVLPRSCAEPGQMALAAGESLRIGAVHRHGNCGLQPDAAIPSAVARLAGLHDRCGRASDLSCG